MRTFLALVAGGLIVAAGSAYGSGTATPAAKLVSTTAKVAPGTHGHLVARCPASMHATGGGYKTDGVAANDSYPFVSGGRVAGWVLTTHKPKTPTTGAAKAGTATAYALCAR